MDAAVPSPVSDYYPEPVLLTLQECKVLVVGDSRSFLGAYPTIAATGLRPARLGRTAGGAVGVSEGAQVPAFANHRHFKCVLSSCLRHSPVMGTENRGKVNVRCA